MNNDLLAIRPKRKKTSESFPTRKPLKLMQKPKLYGLDRTELATFAHHAALFTTNFAATFGMFSSVS